MVQAFLKANLNHLCSCIVIYFAPMVHMDHFLSFMRTCKKTKAQISSAVIARLRSTFVFATYSLHLAAMGSVLAWWLMPQTPDPEVGGTSPTRVKPCCVPEQGTFTPKKVLVIPRKRWLRPNMTEKLFTGMLRINHSTNQHLAATISSL